MATTMRTRPSVRPEALEAAFAFPTPEAIFTRRAPRFALGAEMTGPLATQGTEVFWTNDEALSASPASAGLRERIYEPVFDDRPWPESA